MSSAKERHATILKLLKESGKVDAQKLTDILHTSRETVRRDLNILSKEGHLIKTHGGAISPEYTSLSLFTPIKVREFSNQREKQALCQYAAKAVKEYDMIFIDNSTTASHIINYIPKQYTLTFIVNSLSLLNVLSLMQIPHWTIISLGGILNYGTSSTNRYLAITNLRQFQPNIAFMSCHGIGENFIVTDTGIDDVEIKQYIIQECRKSYLLADASKLPRAGVVKIADAAVFESIITSDLIDSSFLSQLNSHGCKIHLVPAKQ